MPTPNGMYGILPGHSWSADTIDSDEKERPFATSQLEVLLKEFAFIDHLRLWVDKEFLAIIANVLWSENLRYSVQK